MGGGPLKVGRAPAACLLSVLGALQLLLLLLAAAATTLTHTLPLQQERPQGDLHQQTASRQVADGFRDENQEEGEPMPHLHELLKLRSALFSL